MTERSILLCMVTAPYSPVAPGTEFGCHILAGNEYPRNGTLEECARTVRSILKAEKPEITRAIHHTSARFVQTNSNQTRTNETMAASDVAGLLRYHYEKAQRNLPCLFQGLGDDIVPGIEYTAAGKSSSGMANNDANERPQRQFRLARERGDIPSFRKRLADNDLLLYAMPLPISWGCRGRESIELVEADPNAEMKNLIYLTGDYRAVKQTLSQRTDQTRKARHRRALQAGTSVSCLPAAQGFFKPDNLQNSACNSNLSALSCLPQLTQDESRQGPIHLRQPLANAVGTTRTHCVGSVPPFQSAGGSHPRPRSTITARVVPESSWVNQSQNSVSTPAQDSQSTSQTDLPEFDWWAALMGEESGPSATSTHHHPVSAHGWTGQGSQNSEPSDCVDPRVLSRR